MTVVPLEETTLSVPELVEPAKEEAVILTARRPTGRVRQGPIGFGLGVHSAGE